MKIERNVTVTMADMAKAFANASDVEQAEFMEAVAENLTRNSAITQGYYIGAQLAQRNYRLAQALVDEIADGIAESAKEAG